LSPGSPLGRSRGSRGVRTARLAVALFALILCPGCGRDTLAPLAGWDSDYEKAKSQAAQDGKPLAVLFSAAWSKAARTFERKTLADAKIRELLSGYVRVRLDLEANSKAALDELKARDRNDYAGAPWLVLVSPQGERRHVPGQCGPKELAEFLGTLGRWQPLAGWESDQAKAEKQAKESGKPLVVLYSSAWEPAFASFEQKTLADERVKSALAAFTLLRLNIAAHANYGKSEAVPLLVMPAASGKAWEVLDKCSPSALLACIECLAGWKALPGWPADYDAPRKAKADGKPLALILDAADWPSARFLGALQDSPDVAKALEPFARARIEHSRAAPDDRARWGVADSPCLVLFEASGKCRGAYAPKKDPPEPPDRVAERIAEGLKLVSAPKGP
jgi:hypothetical protein